MKKIFIFYILNLYESQEIYLNLNERQVKIVEDIIIENQKNKDYNNIIIDRIQPFTIYHILKITFVVNLIGTIPMYFFTKEKEKILIKENFLEKENMKYKYLFLCNNIMCIGLIALLIPNILNMIFYSKFVSKSFLNFMFPEISYGIKNICIIFIIGTICLFTYLFIRKIYFKDSKQFILKNDLGFIILNEKNFEKHKNLIINNNKKMQEYLLKINELNSTIEIIQSLPLMFDLIIVFVYMVEKYNKYILIKNILTNNYINKQLKKNKETEVIYKELLNFN